MANLYPPGLLGYMAEKQRFAQEDAQGLQNLGGILSIQNQIEQQQEAQKRRQALSEILPKLTDPAARLLAQTGNMQGAIGRQFPQRNPMIVPPNASVIDPSNPTKPLFTSPDKPERPAESDLAKLMRERDALPQGDPRRSIYNQKIAQITTREPKARRTQYDPERGVIIDLDTGRAAPIPGLAARPDKALTESQGNATMFGLRAVEMDNILKSLQQEGYSPTGFRSLKDRMTAGRSATNWMASPEGQQYTNAGRNFVAAVLRKESGAQITEAEWKQGQELYIPMPGDAPDTLTQKAQARQLAISGLREAAGPGGGKIPNQIVPGGTRMPRNTGWSIRPLP